MLITAINAVIQVILTFHWQRDIDARRPGGEESRPVLSDGSAEYWEDMITDLTREDVTRLQEDASPEARANLATKVAAQINASSLTKEQFQIAIDIVEIMARDAAEIVRESLSVNLKASPELPHGVALRLAQDVDAVALPILEYSEVLEDEDLLTLVKSVPEAKQIAIARRNTVSEAVADALVRTENKNVVATVVANEGAELAEETLNHVVDKFGDLEEVQEPLVQRSQLPVTVTERLVSKVSDRLKSYLVAHHDLSSDAAADLVVRTRERATAHLADPNSDSIDVERLVEHLAVNNRLTSSLILRKLCMGDIPFFEAAMARLAGVPIMNTRTLIHDSGDLGFRSLYQKASLPGTLFPAFRLAANVAMDTDFRDADYDPDSYSRTVMERILTQCDELNADDADFLLQKLQDIAPPAFAEA